MRETRSALWLKAGAVLLSALALPALASEETVRPAAPATGDSRATAAARSTAPLKSKKDKVSYALGLEVGKDLLKRSLEVTPDLFLLGLKDALAGSGPLLSDEELRITLADLQAELKRKQGALEAEKVLAANRLAEKNKADGEAFLAANKSREGVVTLESGLQYKILKAGDGSRPTADAEVICNYRGTFVDGTEFDSSYKRKKPVTFPLKGVIKGWSEALQLMPAGSKWQVFIPASLAYGERGSPKSTIGPNTTLIFEVELVSIKEPSAQAGGSGPFGDPGKTGTTRLTEKK